MSFSKRQGSDAVCYTKPLDSLKNWNDHFFWVDSFACPASFPWHTSKTVSKDQMDLFSFIWTVDPTKVRIVERQRGEDEPKLLDATVGRTVPLLPVVPAHAESELEASVGRLFDEEGGPIVRGKSQSAIQRLLAGAVLNAEVRGEVVPTLPFVTSSVSATPEHEEGDHIGSLTGANLRTIGAPQRFVISCDFSHHSGTHFSETGVDSLIRSSAPLMITVTTVTATASAAPVVKETVAKPSLFATASSSAGGTDPVPGGFSDLTDSDLLVGDVRTVVDPDSDLQKVYVPRWNVTNGSLLDENRVCRKMVNEFAPPKFFASVRGMEHDQLFLLTLTWDPHVRAHLLVKEAEATKAIRLRAEASIFKATEKSLRDGVNALNKRNLVLEKERDALNVKVTDLAASVKVREQEVTDLDAQVTAVKSQSENLVGRVHEPETSSVGLQEKVAVYEDFIDQLERFQDEKMEELLTHGMELALAKCLNSTEYLSALGAAISRAVEKGMQEGLSAGITHGAEGRELSDVAAYNPSAEADYHSALQRLQSINFSLIAKLKSNKDSSVDTIMNLLRLDDALAERLGLTESQPHVNQLMVPIHHSPDQRVIGASALSLSLEVSSFRVRKFKENIANHVSALHGVFVPLSEPLSVMALEGTEGTSGVAPSTTTTLSTTFVSASTVSSLSIDDYEITGADNQATVDASTVNEDANPFPNVDDAELNASE
ncbi:hypothetical protein Tco_0432136 [Tanacetum coccineum]